MIEPISVRLIASVGLLATISTTGPSPASLTNSAISVTANATGGAVAFIWRRIGGNAAYASFTAVVPEVPRRIRMVGEWRGEWGHATIGTPGYKRGNRIDMNGDHLRVAGTFRLSSAERTVTLSWATCDDRDLNGDGRIDGADVADVLNYWGANDPFADIDRNGIVDGADLSEVLNGWTP